MPRVRSTAYVLTKTDREIFERATEDPNVFTNWYFRGANTGTWARHDADDKRYQVLHHALFKRWEQLDRPKKFDWAYNTDEVPLVDFITLDGDIIKRGLCIPTIPSPVTASFTLTSRIPAFHINHGFWLQDFQVDFLKSKQEARVLIGGYGCIAPETEIWDVEQGRGVRVDELYREQRAPLVLAWDGVQFVPVRASVPFIKGTDDLYRVTTTHQKSIVVTQEHRLLVPGGWYNTTDILDHFDVPLRTQDGLETAEYIEHVRYGEYYDLHVPHYENYLAQGFINHNSAKTETSLVDILMKAAMLPGFRAFALAFFGSHVTEIYKKMNDRMRGTIYEQRFLLGTSSKPPETIKIGNDAAGENLINFFSIHDSPDKILNLEGDMAMVDQTEQIPNIPVVRSNLSTRLRGFYQSRERLGIVNYVANPNDNPDLWALADDGVDDPENVLFKQMSSYDNWGLTEKQLRRYERDLPRDKATRQSKLYGYRPIGDGRIFTAAMVEACLSVELDAKMDAGLESKLPGFMKHEAPRIGVWRWELPYEENHNYIVIADTGWDSPPNRNAACIGVWDTTMFPDSPATLTAFHWVFGGGSPHPWIQSYIDYVHGYQAISNGYDGTGTGSGYEKWIELFDRVNAKKLSFKAENKYAHINAAKVLMAKGSIQFPTIQAIISQCAKYDFDDKKLVQDVVCMLMLTCSELNVIYFMSQREAADETISAPQERYRWMKGRSRHAFRNR